MRSGFFAAHAPLTCTACDGPRQLEPETLVVECKCETFVAISVFISMFLY